MKENFEEQLKGEINELFKKDPESAKYAIEYNWKTYLDYFLTYFLAARQLNTLPRLLDVGCGPGLVVKELLPYGFQIDGVDFSEGVIEYAKGQRLKVNFQTSSLYALPFGNESFDVVICLGVFQSAEYPLKALQEMARVVKPGGRLIIRTLNKLSLYYPKAQKDNPDFRFYNPFSVKKTLGQLGFAKFKLRGVYLFPYKFLTSLVFTLRLYNLFNLVFPLSVFFAHSFYLEVTKK